jgi:acyl-CoA hydrolase
MGEREGMDLKTVCPEKVVDAETAIAKIKNGSRVFIGTGCGEPQHLIRAMVKNLKHAGHAMVYQMLSWTLSDYVDDARFLRRFALKLFFISREP